MANLLQRNQSGAWGSDTSGTTEGVSQGQSSVPNTTVSIPTTPLSASNVETLRNTGPATTGTTLPTSVPSSPYGPSGSAPSATASDPGVGSDISQAISGSGSFSAMQGAQADIYNPNASNYTIADLPAYQDQQTSIGTGYSTLGTTAANQNSAYQSNVNNSTQSFLNNASGLGTYNDSLASQGSDQQNAAYNAITQMAQGNGPSLAAKNLQAGLNQENQAVQSASMSNQGLGGAGNAQRNAMNAQAANTNNELESAQQASVGEQVGALQNEAAAANDIRSSNQAQASASASAGATLRSQNASALSNEYSAQVAGNSLANTTAATSLAGQSSASNNAFNASVAQTNNNMAYDTALQNEGNTRAQTYTNAVQSGAAASHGTLATLGNIASSGGSAAANANSNDEDDDDDGEDDELKTQSDENMKTNIDQGSNVDNSINALLDLGMGNSVMGSEDTALGGDLSRAAPSVTQTIAPYEAPEQSSSSGSSGSSWTSFLGPLVGLAGLIFSDERAKTDISPGDARSKEFLDNITASSFRYKNPSHPNATEGENLGVMAQDMQRSKIGRALVEKGPDGYLRYSVPKAVNLSLASLAHLNKRINALEKSK